MGKSTSAGFETMGEVLARLGDIDPGRVRLRPAPGRATEADLVRLQARAGRLYELVEGTLVEKALGFPESTLAMWLGHVLQSYLDANDLGFVSGEGGTIRLLQGLVRMPDVAFIAWDKVPRKGEIPTEPVAGLVPDLAVEVLSPSNTQAEVRRKLKEYFLAGVRLVWLIDPQTRQAHVHTAPDEAETLTEGQTLTGGDVLPGLAVPLDRLFARLPRPRGRKRKS